MQEKPTLDYETADAAEGQFSPSTYRKIGAAIIGGGILVLAIILVTSLFDLGRYSASLNELLERIGLWIVVVIFGGITVLVLADCGGSITTAMTTPTTTGTLIRRPITSFSPRALRLCGLRRTPSSRGS
ncbi:MAG TPA: hypothetical protein VFE47_32270 [Tepidisphaeraceae bacterium]|jgi:hypothetical protein|nr:hypothetical protein [Tepidisphaeraceae bacterium]